MSSKSEVPDAWDDDWEGIADKPEITNPKNVPRDVKVTKAERKAMHAEMNREIWESAENPNPVFLPRGHENVPLQSTFKPNVTVLSRKPRPQVLSRNDPAAGMSDLCIADDDDDSEEERRKQAEQSFAERQARAEKEREEKLRKYQEAREKIFGSPAPSSGESRGASPKPSRGRGRGRGGRDGQRSSTEQSPARPNASGRQLYDASYSVKPGSIYIQKQDAGSSRPATPNEQRMPIREPRGPQNGRGFAPRGNHSS